MITDTDITFSEDTYVSDISKKIKEMTAEEKYVRRFHAPEFFAYFAESGPEAGWHLYRDEEDGEETTLCKIDTVERLEAAVLLFELDG